MPYNQQKMMATSQGFQHRFASGLEPEEFKVFDKRDRHPEWFDIAAPVIRRVTEVWERVGLVFPESEVMEAW